MKQYISNDTHCEEEFLYSSCEDGIKGKYSETAMKKLYMKTVNKSEYPTYDGWKDDMLRSGVFDRLKKQLS